MNEWNDDDRPRLAAVNDTGGRRLNTWPPMPVDTALEWLRASYPDWHVWIVYTWDGMKGGIVWCARRHTDGKVVNAESPGHLAEYVAHAGEWWEG